MIAARAGLGEKLIGLSALILMGIGTYFVFFRPAFLPEDLVYIGSSQSIENLVPKIGTWLRKVFFVLGGFIISTGLLKLGLLRQSPSSKSVMLFFAAWAVSIGQMSFINFVINSDHKWSLFALAALELSGIGILWVSQKNTKNLI